jgi:hypothetical protein
MKPLLREQANSRFINDFKGEVVSWLGREDSNLRMAESKSAALPLGDAPKRGNWPLEAPQGLPAAGP